MATPGKRPRAAVTERRPKRKRVVELGFPRSDRDRMFCDRWLLHFDHVRAYLEAGWAPNDRIGKLGTNTAVRARQKLEHLWPYLEPLRDAKARIVAERVALSQADLLDLLGRMAKFNPLEYVETSTTAATTTRTAADGAKIEDPIEFNGKPVFRSRLKPLQDLTPEQAATIQLHADGDTVTYRLPNIRERHAALLLLGKQMGMFLDKIILQNHEHQHRHAHLHLEGVSTDQVRALAAQLSQFVEPEFAKGLGYTDEDIARMRAAAPIKTGN